MKQMKKNWPRKRLGEVLLKKPQYGLTAKASLEKKKYRYIRITDITEEGRLKRDNFRYVNLNETDFNKYKLENGDFLIARSGSVGRIYLHQNSSKDCVFASYLIRFKLNHKVLMPKYLFYYALSPNYKQMIENTLRKTSQPNINAQEFSNFEIPLPPLEIQRQIVARIEKTFTEIDKATELRQKACEETEQIFTSALQKVFSKVEKKYNKTEIKNFAKVKGGKRLPKNSIFSEKKTDYPYIRVVDLKNFSVEITNLKYIPNEIQQKILRYTILKDDVYISIAGTIGLVGVIPDSLDGANLTENAAKIVIRDETIDKKYLVYYLSSPFGKKEIDNRTNKLGQPKLALMRIETIKIPVPPISEQKKIVDYLDNIQEKVGKLKSLQQEQLTYIEELKKSVLENTLC
jgi:type I restriction enzyme, S subunit